MQDNIKNILKNIEQENDIKILFAIENGSRSWQMASADSDYDIRFVFYRDKKDYLSLKKKPEVLYSAYDKELKPCEVQGSLIDICGFDIYKYLKLLLSSNPTTIEWLFSPILYYGNNDLSLRQYVAENFSQERLYRHYFSLFRNNYREFIEQDKMISYKKYLYSMRGLLNSQYVLEFDKIPPLSFIETVEALKSQIPIDVYNKILEVIKIKSKGLEKDIITRIFEFDQYFYASMDIGDLKFSSKTLDYKVFNELIYELLSIIR